MQTHLCFNKKYFFFENNSNFDKIIKFKFKFNRFSKIKFNRLLFSFFQSTTNFIVFFWIFLLSTSLFFFTISLLCFLTSSMFFRITLLFEISLLKFFFSIFFYSKLYFDSSKKIRKWLNASRFFSKFRCLKSLFFFIFRYFFNYRFDNDQNFFVLIHIV